MQVRCGVGGKLPNSPHEGTTWFMFCVDGASERMELRSDTENEKTLSALSPGSPEFLQK